MVIQILEEKKKRWAIYTMQFPQRIRTARCTHIFTPLLSDMNSYQYLIVVVLFFVDYLIAPDEMIINKI